MSDHYDGCERWRHLYADKPDDFAVMVRTGWVWMLSRETQQRAVEAMVRGDLPTNDRVPPQIAEYVRARRPGA